MTPRNPDLPILDELGAEFEGMVSAAWAGGADGAPAPVADGHAPRRRLPATPNRASRERGAQARRVGRRAAIVLLLVCLIGGVAFAALNGGGSNDHAHTAPTVLGRAGDHAWSFSAYRDEGRLCTVFVPRGGELSGSCGAAPDHGQVRAGSALAGGHRYVFGVAGPGVRRVSTKLGAKLPASFDRLNGLGSVRDPADRVAAIDAGFPASDGWFVLDLGPVGDADRSRAPAIVFPLDRHGRHAGPAYVDCSLGILNAACKRRIEAAAAGR